MEPSEFEELENRVHALEDLVVEIAKIVAGPLNMLAQNPKLDQNSCDALSRVSSELKKAVKETNLDWD